MIHLVISFLVLFVFTLNNYRKKGFQVSTFLLALYLFSLLCCIVLVRKNNETLILQGDYGIPIIIVLLMWLTQLAPFYFVKENSFKEIELPNMHTLNVFAVIMIVLSFFAIIVFSQDVSELLKIRAVYGDIASTRDDIAGGRIGRGGGFAYSLSAIVAFSFVIPLFLSFIYLIIEKRGMASILFVSSLSYPLYVLNSFGRDGVLFWVFSVISCYAIFSSYLSGKNKKSIKFIILVFILIMSIPFFVISNSRFGEEVNSSLLTYAGSSFKNAAYFVGTENYPYQFGNCFPLFFKDMFPVVGSWNYVKGTISTAFGSLVVPFCSSFRIAGAFIFCLLSWWVFSKMMRVKNNKLSFYQLFVYLMYFEVISQGLFYFRHGYNGGNYYIILSFVLYYLFKNNMKKQGSFVLSQSVKSKV